MNFKKYNVLTQISSYRYSQKEDYAKYSKKSANLLSS